MKKITFFLLIIFYPLYILAQSFPGYRTGNYNGVYSSFFNPAGVAQNNYKWDLSLIGLSANLGNNNENFGFKKLKEFADGNYDLSQLGNDYEVISAFVGAELVGPSFLLSKDKWGLAITTRARSMVNVSDIDGNLLNAIDNISIHGTPYTLQSPGTQKIAANSWSEFGLTYAKVLSQNDKSVFKMGITGKYLAGAANTWLQVSDLQGTLANTGFSNYYLTDANARVSTGYSGFDINNFELSDLMKMKGTGFGGDIGFSFETKTAGKKNKKDNFAPYDIRIGVSLTDIGVIRYKANDYADYTMAVSASEQWFPSDLDGKSINEIKSYLETSPYFTKNSTNATPSYNVKMPMALNLNTDIAMSKNFYTDIAAHINLAGKTDTYNSFSYTAFSVTPRLEKPAFGLYFPFTYSTLSDFNAGFSFRVGPLFVGSGSLFTVLMNNSKQADVHVGLRIGGLAKRKEKKPSEKTNKEENSSKTEEKPDKDSDGIPDAEDKCPDISGLARYNGCPIPDTDNDGINDEADSCKLVPGLAKYHGCPVPDSDKDGIDDENDKCPNLAGKAEDKGCPVVTKEIVQKVNVAAKKIYFKTASYDLLPESSKGLNDVVAILKANPDLRLVVDGYTDNVGLAERNKVLSQLRADAVKYYILAQGIDASRVTSTGHGEENPVADNKTNEGRSKNRRVEMKTEY